MKYTYQIEIAELSKTEILKRIDENGVVSFIPMDKANSDYQKYLNSEVKHLTEIIPTDEA
jgi:hypothetical protein